jgi:hypothetical protein
MYICSESYIKKITEEVIYMNWILECCGPIVIKSSVPYDASLTGSRYLYVVCIIWNQTIILTVHIR